MANHDDPSSPLFRSARPAKWVSIGFVLIIAAYTGLYAYESWLGAERHALHQVSDLSSYTAHELDSGFRQLALNMRLFAHLIRVKGDVTHLRRAQALLRRNQRFWPGLAEMDLARLQGGPGHPVARHLHPSFLQVGRPTQDPRTGQWRIPIDHAFHGTNGQHGFVMQAMLPLTSQHLMWRTIGLRPGAYIGVMRQDGYMENVWPVPPGASMRQVYERPHSGVVVQALRQYPTAMHHTFAGFTLPLRMHLFGSFTRLPHDPGLAVFAVVPFAAVRAAWIHGMRLPFLLALILIVGAVLVHYWSKYQFERWERERENVLAREMRQRDFYAALSDINQLIAHHPDPHHLFTRVCDIVVTHTYLRLAWIGIIEPNGNAAVVAASGSAHAYARDLRVSTDPDVPEGQGPFGRAFRSGQTLIIRNLVAEGSFELWQERALTHGLAACGSFPFKRDGKVVGVLLVYAGSADFFEPELVQLLEELALDISFSLEDFDRQQELLRLALHDTLTGLANRQLFMDRLGLGLAIARRDDRLVAVGIIDLDDFKQINDRLGHAAGDEALKQVCRRMLGWIRETDTLARLGGDEFGIVLGSAYNIQEIITILQRIIGAIAAPLTLEGGETIALTASIGVAIHPFDDTDPHNLMRHADLALYRAKEAGGNTYAFFEQPLEDEMLAQHRSRAEVQRAFRRHEFVVHYLPQVDMSDGRVLGVEALVRWQHPERGLLMPAAFIGVIEDDVQFIRELGRFVLDESARKVRDWQREGLDLVASVNIGARHLLSSEFMHDIREVLARYPGIARQLTLEVTETDALRDLNQTGQVLNECRRLGLRISIDDFGSGYASLTYLQKLPIDQIKIDQGFVRGLLDDPKNIAIIAGLIGVVKLLRIEMIAEGVESIEHGNLLLKLGSSLAQGYAIAKAMEPDAVASWVSAWKPDKIWVRMAQHPYASEDYGLLMLLMQHDKQMRTLLASLSQVLADPAAPPLRQEDFQCVIDDWYEREGRPRYGHLPVFAEIRETYHRLCDEVQGLLQAVLSGVSIEERMARLSELDQRLRREFDRLLLTY